MVEDMEISGAEDGPEELENEMAPEEEGEEDEL